MSQINTAISLVSYLESLHFGSEELDARLLELYGKPPGSLTPTRDIRHTISLIPPEYYWWSVSMRKLMPEWGATEPFNKRSPFYACAGLHSNSDGRGRRGANGHANTAELALCAAYLHASKINMRNV